MSLAKNFNRNASLREIINRLKYCKYPFNFSCINPRGEWEMLNNSHLYCYIKLVINKEIYFVYDFAQSLCFFSFPCQSPICLEHSD